MTRWMIAAAALAAGLAPLLPKAAPAPPPPVTWPKSFEGRALTPMQPTAFDAVIARDFPGRIARFSDGKRQIVLRSVHGATRALHSARTCFTATGHALSSAPMRVKDGRASSCFEASKGGKRVLVCERIDGPAGASFPDPSSWYWPALTGNSKGPWLAVTSVEPIG